MVTILIFLLAFIGCVLQGVFIVVEHKEKYVPAVILKGSASLCFVLIGLINVFNGTPAQISKLILIGLILGMFGDILLNLRFVFKKIGSKIFLVGVASFLAGHILYLISVLNMAYTNIWLFLGIGAVVAAIILFIIFKTIPGLKISYKIFGILYIGSISLMTLSAINLLVTLPSALSIVFAIGAVSFLASDIVLIFNSFGKERKFSLRITNLTLYYIGQLLIAFSIIFINGMIN